MPITEAVALWIKAKADRLAHLHQWEVVQRVKVSREDGGTKGFEHYFTCKTCEESKVVKTY